VDRTEMLAMELEGALNTAFEAVEELDALLRLHLGGNPSPIAEVESRAGREALACIREAGEEVQRIVHPPSPFTHFLMPPERRADRLRVLLRDAFGSVGELDALILWVRGAEPTAGRSEPARRAMAALRRAARKLDLLMEALAASSAEVVLAAWS
jgi:hypothetical protein